MFYLSILILLIFFSIGQVYSRSKSEIQLSNVLFYTVIFLFIIIGGFRFETGGDWPGYKALYDGTDLRSIEPLFQCVIFLAKIFGDYQWIFVFCELIRFVTMAIILEKCTLYDKKYKMLFILLYYVMYWFYYDLVIIRQSTAAAIFGFGLLREKNISFKKYSFYVLLAIGFHYSSIVLFFVYPFLFKVSKKTMGFFSFIVVLFYLLGIDLFSTILVSILEILPKKFYLIYRLYAYTQIAALATARKLTGQTLVYLLVFFIMLYKEFILKERENSLFFNGVCMFMLLFFGFPSFSTICTRLASNFSIFIIFNIISIINYYKKTVIVPILLVILCCCFNKGVFFEQPDKIAYNPYQFYWTHKIFNLPSDGLERLYATPD